MGWFSNKIRREDLKHGDHIYTWRRGFSYSHHGIYEGDGKVIHLTRGPGSNGFSSSPSHPSEGPVLSCNLEDFLSGGDLYRFEYGVNALYFLIKRSGTCTRAYTDPPEHVLYRAYFLLTDGFGDYDLSNNNCEDFAFYCKTELLDLQGSRKTGTSGQIASLVAGITTIFAYIIMPYGFLPTSFTGLPLMFCFIYCNSRLHFDPGSRTCYILEKVPVEKFNQLSYSETVLMRSDAKWILMLAISALIVWYWTPESIILLFIRTFFLYFLLYLLFFDYLRNHRFKIFVHIYKNILVLMIWYWTPESTLLQDIRTFFLHGFIDAVVIDPLINRRLKLWQYIMGAVFTFKCWYWIPESTIFQWIRLFLLNVSFCDLVNLRNHHVKSSLFIWNFISAFIIWYWTPESTILQWLRLLLLYGLYALLVINPNFRWKLRNYFDDTIWVIGLWYWTPEGTILQWIRLCLLNFHFFKVKSVNCLFLFLRNAVLFGLVTNISRILWLVSISIFVLGLFGKLYV